MRLSARMGYGGILAHRFDRPGTPGTRPDVCSYEGEPGRQSVSLSSDHRFALNPSIVVDRPINEDGKNRKRCVHGNFPGASSVS